MNNYAQNGGTTGPYHRVYTVPGFSRITASVYLPSGLDVSEHDIDNAPLKTQDTAYVYTGGWGKGGHAVDAGLQHSPLNDTWTAVLNCELFGIHADTLALAGDQTVALDFAVAAEGVLRLSVRGKTVAGVLATRTLSIDISHFPEGHARHGEPADLGWHPSGDGIVLKRMVSIAQKPQNFESGAYIQGVRWSACRLGAAGFAKAMRPWEQGDTGGSHAWPDKARVLASEPAPDASTTTIALGPLPAPA